MNISYAQNFEDVMLWRALGHVQGGFYIDIGAQDPLVDSVSLMFHEKGWRGIHVEPTVHYAGLLRQQRPGDTVIQAAVGNTVGVLPLFEIPGTGISTLDPAIAAQHRERGFDVRETTTPIVPLLTVLSLAESRDVHWMKIDVEGYERQVLASWGDSAVRPWVVVVESTLPLTQVQSHDRWEGLLIDKGYTFVYFDGLNRYYVSDKHPQLRAAFAAPPNVFDEFALNGTASATFHLLIQQKYEAQLDELRQRLKEQIETAQSELSAVRSAAQVDQEAWIRSRQELEHAASEARAQLASVEDALEAASQQLRLHAERESSLQQQLEAARAELLRAERETAQLHAALSEQLRWAMDALQAQTRANAEAHALAHRLVETHQAQLQATEQAHSVAQQALHSDIARLQARTEGAERLVQQLQDQLEASRLDAQARQQDAQAREAALRAEVAAQQARLQALQSTLNGLAAERSLLETSVLGRLSLRQMRRTRAAQGHADPVPVAPASTGGSAAPTPPSSTPSIDMPPTTLSLDPDQARLEDLLGLHDAEFVQEAFRLLLGRAADPQGLAHYLRHVRQGRDKRHILMDIYSSSECKARLATQPSLKRFFPGRRAWLWPVIGPLLRKLDARRSRRAASRRLRMIDNDFHRHRAQAEQQLQRQEALLDHGSVSSGEALSDRSNHQAHLNDSSVLKNSKLAASNTLSWIVAAEDLDFIRRAYTTLLRRSPDPVGLAHYSERLRNGESKIQIIRDLRKSAEGRAASVSVEGLEAELIKLRLSRLPLLGPLIGLLLSVDGNSPAERRLRRIEQTLFTLRDVLSSSHPLKADFLTREEYLIVSSGANSPLRAASNHERSDAEHATPAQKYGPLKVQGASPETILDELKNYVRNSASFG